MQKSDSIAALAASLCKAQETMKAAIKDSDNPFFKSKYADLATIIAASKDPLAANGLAFAQTTDLAETVTVRRSEVPEESEDKWLAKTMMCVTVETILMHTSGEWIMGAMRMPVPKSDPQSVGSAVTYARRYGLQAIIGLPTDDDDGEAASQHDAHAPSRPTSPAKPRPTSAPAQSLPTANHRITVKSVNVTEGKGPKGPWERTDVEATSGDRYSTFDKNLGPLCMGLEGKDCYVEFTVNDKGYNVLKSIEVA